jgi:YHS domain-containing protein
MADTETITRDPICGMTVDPAAGKPSHEHGGHLYHFCNPRCLDKFVAEPDAHVSATDPVCGMSVDRATARHMAKHAGERFYFCSGACMAKFEAAPETYLGDRPEPEPMPEGTLYTCPMDPEIVQEGPGDCPICGMALEPMTPTADAGPNPELIDFKHRFLIGASLTVPLLVLTMGPFLGLPVREPDRTVAGTDHGPIAGPARTRVDRRAPDAVDRACAGQPGHPVVRLAVPGARCKVVPDHEPPYVQPDRHGRWRSVSVQHRRGAVQHRRGAGAGDIPRRLPRSARQCRGLFRSRRGDRGAGSARPDHARTAPRRRSRWSR